MGTPSETPMTKNTRTRLPMQAFTWGAVGLVFVFGLFTLVNTIRTSAATQLMDRLGKRFRFEEVHKRWDTELRLDTLEQAPWLQRAGIDSRKITPHEGIMVINLWAAYCEPCKKEIPSMIRAARDFHGKVTFVFISYDDSWQAPRKVLNEILKGVPGGVCMIRDPKATDEDGSIMKALGATKVPETFFVRDGMIMSKFIGDVDWDDKDVRQYLALLASN